MPVGRVSLGSGEQSQRRGGTQNAQLAVSQRAGELCTPGFWRAYSGVVLERRSGQSRARWENRRGRCALGVRKRICADPQREPRPLQCRHDVRRARGRVRAGTRRHGRRRPDLLRGAPPQADWPHCEASTLTEYSQRNDTALVSGTVSISNCSAGTTGGFTLVARVRNDAGDVTPIEFKQTWERHDAEDHKFQAEYPIGENVFLQSVRAHLTCTCAAPAQ